MGKDVKILEVLRGLLPRLVRVTSPLYDISLNELLYRTMKVLLNASSSYDLLSHVRPQTFHQTGRISLATIHTVRDHDLPTKHLTHVYCRDHWHVRISLFFSGWQV